MPSEMEQLFLLGVALARFQYQITSSQEWQSGSRNDKQPTYIRYADKAKSLQPECSGVQLTGDLSWNSSEMCKCRERNFNVSNIYSWLHSEKIWKDLWSIKQIIYKYIL